jgi:hypothetical protein
VTWKQKTYLVNLLLLDKRKRTCKDHKSVRNSICREFMKHVAVTFAVISFLPCLGLQPRYGIDPSAEIGNLLKSLVLRAPPSVMFVAVWSVTEI